MSILVYPNWKVTTGFSLHFYQLHRLLSLVLPAVGTLFRRVLRDHFRAFLYQNYNRETLPSFL